MLEKHDLTTPEGRKAIIEALKSNRILMFTGIGPYIMLLDKAIELFDAGRMCEVQKKAAVELIKAGKENGAKKIKIVMDQEAGVNLKVPIEDIHITAMAGTNGKMTIEVEYA